MTTPAASSADQTGRATSERTPTDASTVLGLLIPALPASRIGAGATIGPASLVMRGDEVPPWTRWQGNPIAPWTKSKKKRAE